MKKFFKWLLIILLAILTCPFVLLFGGFIIILLEFVAALIVATSPIWIPIAAVGLVAELLLD